MTARFVDDLGQLFLGVAVQVDQLLVGIGFLDRIQILALDILDQRQLGSARIVDVAHDRWDRVKPCPLRFVQRRPVRRERQTIPPRRQVLPYARNGDRGSRAVSPAQVGPARPVGRIARPVQSSSHFPRGVGLRPLRMSQRR